jgi:hypothetical protein
MASIDFGRNYFSKPPQKSFYFWSTTIWLLVVLSMALVFGRHFYGRLSTDGLWWLCLSVAAPIILWLRAWQSHAKLSEMSLKSRGSNMEDQARLDAVLTEAAYLENTGLGIALFVLTTALIGFSKVLGK